MAVLLNKRIMSGKVTLFFCLEKTRPTPVTAGNDKTLLHQQPVGGIGAAAGRLKAKGMVPSIIRTPARLASIGIDFDNMVLTMKFSFVLI